MRVLSVRGARMGCFVLAGATVMALSIAPPAAHPRITTALSWRADIYPILERRCLSCHRAGGIAPMSFEDYETARPWARAIREEVLERRMPPTAIRSGAGLYENARTLSIAETELLAAWVDGGAPSGTEPGAVVPAEPAPAADTGPVVDWDRAIPGKPVASEDSLTTRVQFAVPAGWIGAWTLDAGGLPARSARLSFSDGTVLGSWTPDERPVRYPEGAGVRIERATTVNADVTLTAAIDAAERAAAKPQLKLATRADAHQRIMSRRVREASSKVAAGETLLALRLELENPEANAEVIVTRQNGDQSFLMAMAPPGVPDPISYRFRVPLSLDAGDIIRVNTTAPFVLTLEALQAATRSTRGRR
jgi:hypothetical protein